MTISVVICAYTEARWSNLVAAVGSARKQKYGAAEVIVVVDHNPALLARVRLELPEAVAVANSGVQGLSGARNSGVARATGDIVAFLDDDAAATPDWLEKLAQTYAQGPEVIGVGGAIQPWWSRGQPRWFPEEFGWVVGCTYEGMPKTLSRVRNLIGANMSFRRAVLEQLGGFRSEVGRVGTTALGCEETELCIRAAQHFPGSLILYQPDALVMHYVTPDRGTWRYFTTRCYSEGLSKALVTRFVGAADGLSSERAYTFKTLPLGVAHGVSDVLRFGDAAGLRRSGAILAGLACTVTGYAVGTLRSRPRRKLRVA